MTKTGSEQDVRMRGFSRRTEVDDFLHWVDAHTSALEDEVVSLSAACGRVLATDIVAQLDVPEFDRSAMDGYAVQAEATEGAGDYNPIAFHIVGHAWPGCPYEGSVPTGAAVRIMTGAPVPAGVNAVVPAEYAKASESRVEVTQAVSSGKHIGRKGEDIKQGSCPLYAGRILRPQDLGLIASLGIPAVQGVRRPRVRILITGNELVPPGKPKKLYEIYDANSSLLQALVVRDGGEIESLQHCVDDPNAIAQAMAASGADVILISGGSSVGSEDHAPRLLADLGQLVIHGVAMRPSSPAGAGLIRGVAVFLLPGNPVSCLFAYVFFAGRAIRRLGGLPPDWPYFSRHLRLSRKLVSDVGRVDYCRVRLDGLASVEPLALSGASILSSTVRADGFVVVPSASEGFGQGEEVCVYLYDRVPHFDEA
ncbi:MAG: gephyrin-like molybdotransferase Glp [Burkholderiaceae bacterium]